MRLTASDIVSMYRPTFCSGRVFLRGKKEPEAPASAFDELLSRLGTRVIGIRSRTDANRAENKYLGKVIEQVTYHIGQISREWNEFAKEWRYE